MFTVTVMRFNRVFILVSPLHRREQTVTQLLPHTQTHSRRTAHARTHFTVTHFLFTSWTLEKSEMVGPQDEQPSAVIGSLVTQKIHVSIGHMGY